MFNLSVLLLDDALLKCVVTEVVLCTNYTFRFSFRETLSSDFFTVTSVSQTLWSGPHHVYPVHCKFMGPHMPRLKATLHSSMHYSRVRLASVEIWTNDVRADERRVPA